VRTKKNEGLADAIRIGFWSSFCFRLWTAELKRPKEPLCCFNRAANLRIGNERGECSNVLRQLFKLLIRWIYTEFRSDVSDDQSHY
jgi:hypothetical protein